jgi:hypothetical protein
LFLAEQPLGLLPQVQHRWIIWWLLAEAVVGIGYRPRIMGVVVVPEDLELEPD